MWSDTQPEVRRWIGMAERAGWRVIFTRRGHVIFTAPDGRHVTTPRKHDGDQRGLRNARAQLRRGGLEV